MTLAEINELRQQLWEAGFKNNNIGSWVKMGRHPAFDYDSLDWTKSNAALSRETGASVGSIYQWRLKLNKPSAPYDRQRSPVAGVVVPSLRVDHSTIDWTKTDVEISKEKGFTREYARQLRARYGKARVYCATRNYEDFCKKFEGVKELLFEDASQKFFISFQTFRKYCAKAGIKVLQKKPGHESIYCWEDFDWNLPNKVLTDIWGVSENVVAGYRSRRRMTGAKFRHADSRTIPIQWRATVEAQKIKAAAFKSNGKTTYEPKPKPEPTNQTPEQYIMSSMRLQD